MAILPDNMAGDNDRQMSPAQVMRLLDMVRQLGAPCDLGEMLEMVIDVSREILCADRGTVFLFDEPARELYLKVATDLKELRFSIDGSGFAHECARTQQIINVPDCYADKRFNQDFDKKTGYRTRCLIAVPLIGLEDKLVGVMQVLNKEDDGVFDESDEQIASALASQAAVAIQRSMLIDERMIKIKMENDMEIAREIQQNVLPDELPKITGYEIASFSRPADETGGDIYDVGRRPEDEEDDSAPVMLMLADATGHGIGPALSVTQSRAMFRIGLRLGADLDELVEHIDEQLDMDLSSSRFITAFFGKLDPQKHQIYYNAPGQGPLLQYIAAEQRFDSRAATNVPLGIMPGTPDDEHEPFTLAVDDMFLLLTDGFIEGINEQEQEFGEDRILQVVREHATCSAEQVIGALVGALDDFKGNGPQLDDWTAVIIKRVE
jgi:phosphoserine phosphatase